MTQTPRTRVSTDSTIAADQALVIAQADAARAYRDLTAYRIQLFLEGGGWHIDYELTNPKLKGGGPHYVIDAWRCDSFRRVMNSDATSAIGFARSLNPHRESENLAFGEVLSHH